MRRACIAVIDASRARLFTWQRSADPDDLCEDLTVHRARVDPVDELDHGFTTALLRALAELLRSAPAQRLIVCASPPMLGRLRRPITKLTHASTTHDPTTDDSVIIVELPRDLTRLTPSELHARLASYGLLPARAGRATTGAAPATP